MSCWIFSQNCLRWKNVLFGCSCKEYKLCKTNIWFCYIVSRSTRTMLGSGSCTRKSQSGGTQMFSLVWDQLNGNEANEWQEWWLAGARSMVSRIQFKWNRYLRILQCTFNMKGRRQKRLITQWVVGRYCLADVDNQTLHFAICGFLRFRINQTGIFSTHAQRSTAAQE